MVHEFNKVKSLYFFLFYRYIKVWHVKGKLNGRSRLLSIKEYKVECNIHHGSQIV